MVFLVRITSQDEKNSVVAKTVTLFLKALTPRIKI